MSVGTSGSTINPKPFFSLNHLTVPLAIDPTKNELITWNRSSCKNGQELVQLSALLEKATRISIFRHKRQEECNTIISSRIRLAFFCSDRFVSAMAGDCLVAVVMGSKS